MLTREDNNPYLIHTLVQANDVNGLKHFLADETISPNEKSQLINTLNDAQLSPLACALKSGKNAIATLLLEHGADVSVGGVHMGKTTLDYANCCPTLLSQVESKTIDAVINFPKEGLREDQKAQQALIAFSLAEYYARKNNSEYKLKYLKLATGLSSKIVPVALLLAPVTWKQLTLSLLSQESYLKSGVLYANWIRQVSSIGEDDKIHIQFESEAYINALCTLITIPEPEVSLDFVTQMMSDILKNIKTKEPAFSLNEVCTQVLDRLKDQVSEVQYNNLSCLTKLIYDFVISRNQEFCGTLSDKLTRLAMSAIASGNFDLGLALFKGSQHYVKYAVKKNEHDEKRYKALAGINDTHINTLENYYLFEEAMRKNYPSFTEAVNSSNYRLAILLMREPFMQYYSSISRLNNIKKFPIHTISKIIQTYAVKKNKDATLIIGNYKLDSQFTKENFLNIVRDFDFFVKLLHITRYPNDVKTLQLALSNTISSIFQIKSFKSVDAIFARERIFELIDFCISCDNLLISITGEKTISDLKFYGLPYLYKMTKSPYVLKNKSDPSSANIFKIIADKYKRAFDELKRIITDFSIPAEYISLYAYANLNAKQYEAAKEQFTLALPATLDKLLQCNNQKEPRFEFFTMNFIRTIVGFATLSNKNIILNNALAGSLKLDELIDATRQTFSFISYALREKIVKYTHAFYVFWDMQIKYYKAQKNYSDLVKSRLFVIEGIFSNTNLFQQEKSEYLLFLSKEFSDLILEYKIQAEKNLSQDQNQVYNIQEEHTLKSLIAFKPYIIRILSQLIDAKMKSDVNEFLQNIIEHLDLFAQLGEERGALVANILKILSDKQYEISKTLSTHMKFYQLQTFEQETLERQQQADMLTKNLAHCQKYFLKTKAYPKNYDDVLITTAKRLNQWHTANNQFEKALEFCNMVITRLMQKDNPDQRLLNSMLTSANEHMLKIAKKYASNNNLIKAVNTYYTIVENSDFIGDQKTLFLALNEQLALSLTHVKQLMSIHKYNKVLQICHETHVHLHKHCAQVEEEFPLISELNSIRKNAETLQNEIRLMDKPSHTAFFTSEDIYRQKFKATKRRSGKNQDVNVNLNEDVKVNEKDRKAEVVDDFLEQTPVIPNAKVGNKIEARFLSKEGAALYPVVVNDIAEFEKLRATNVFLYGEIKEAALGGWVCREFGESGNKYIGGGVWEAKVIGSRARLFGSKENINGTNCIVYRHFDPNGLHKSK